MFKLSKTVEVPRNSDEETATVLFVCLFSS